MENRGGSVVHMSFRRLEYLRAVADDGRTKRHLEQQLGDSRSTVDRALRELEQWDLVTRTDEQYRLTLAGVLVHFELERLLSRISGIHHATPALREMPPTTELSGALFEESTVIIPEEGTLRGPIDDHSSLLERAEDLRTIGSVLLPQLIDIYYRRVVNDGIPAKIVLSEPVLERLVAIYADQFREALQLDHFSIKQIPQEFEYGQVIAETATGRRVGILLYGQSEIRGFASSAAPSAVRWAEDRFERIWSNAEPISDPPSAD